MELTKNVHAHKYPYSGYVIGFNALLQFPLPSGERGKNIVIFGLDNSLSVHVDNRKKDILSLGERPPDGLDDTTITAEAKCSVNISNHRNKICTTMQPTVF